MLLSDLPCSVADCVIGRVVHAVIRTRIHRIDIAQNHLTSIQEHSIIKFVRERNTDALETSIT